MCSSWVTGSLSMPQVYLGGRHAAIVPNCTDYAAVVQERRAGRSRRDRLGEAVVDNWKCFLTTAFSFLSEQGQSIYMITSVPCRTVPSVRCRMSGDVAWRPRWPRRHKGKDALLWRWHITRSERRSNKSTIARTKNSRVQTRQANSSGDRAARRLPLCAYRARKTARWMSGARSRRTAQAERLTLVQDELQWRLLPSVNRTPLKGVTD